MNFQQAILGSLLLALALAAPSAKIEPRLNAALKAKNTVNIFVKFQGGNSAALRIPRTGSRTEQVNHLVSGLKSLSQSSQQNAINFLRARAPFASFKQLWVSNELSVKGASAQLVYQLAALPEVEEIREERVISMEPLNLGEGIAPHAEWNMDKIEAAGAWQLPGGNNGQGVVVATIDTGVRRTHEALRNNQRASYNWFDPYDGSSESADGNGHGTHTMGTLAGSGGIGVAPGAQWITCRGCSAISCTEEALKSCGQWALCPTLPDGASEDCSQAPSLVSNSWGGGQNNDFYNEVIRAWKAANIIPIFAIGNGGPTCGTANSPGDQEVIGVGATTQEDNISESSSTGPLADGTIKPDLTAPGTLIRSAWSSSDNSYQTISGTSMSAPHVAGAAALLLAQNPNLSYAEVKALLENNADRDLVDTGVTCGGIPSTQFPNNQYGHGRLNARKALAAAISGI